MNLAAALAIAEDIRAQLAPHCHRCEIAGSIRRRKPEVKDIEIVAIPKPYDIGLFASGVAKVVDQWKAVKGQLPCKYTQRILPDGIKLDLFFANPDNWGLIYAIRTGSADYSHKVLAAGWSARGFRSHEGMLYSRVGHPIPMPEEEDLFKFLGIPFCKPEDRNV